MRPSRSSLKAGFAANVKECICCGSGDLARFSSVALFRRHGRYTPVGLSRYARRGRSLSGKVFSPMCLWGGVQFACGCLAAMVGCFQARFPVAGQALLPVLALIGGFHVLGDYSSTRAGVAIRLDRWAQARWWGLRQFHDESTAFAHLLIRGGIASF